MTILTSVPTNYLACLFITLQGESKKFIRTIKFDDIQLIPMSRISLNAINFYLNMKMGRVARRSKKKRDLFLYNFSINLLTMHKF